jgi:hypothetical protein
MPAEGRHHARHEPVLFFVAVARRGHDPLPPQVDGHVPVHLLRVFEHRPRQHRVGGTQPVDGEFPIVPQRRLNELALR